MRDLQHRLAALHLSCAEDREATFGEATATAVRRFQEQRGLPDDGTCDRTTWDALVESGWRLGDRPLYATTPMLRGDDVGDLQRRLGALGFDAGRVDGIFGPLAERALVDFQRNAGLVADAICGPATVAALARLGDRDAGAAIVDVRERERFRCRPRTLAGLTVAIAHGGGLDALASSTARAIRATGATSFVIQHPDGSEQAAQANAIEADVFLGLAFARGGDSRGCTTAYWRSPTGWESNGGRLLAELLHQSVARVLPCPDAGTTPMSVPVLRETRMPAVVVELGPAGAVVEHTGDLASTITRVLERWVGEYAGDRSLS